MLNVNHDRSVDGVPTDTPGGLTNDFFAKLTDTNLIREKAAGDGLSFLLDDRETGAAKFTATHNDLVFGIIGPENGLTRTSQGRRDRPAGFPIPRPV